MTITAKDCFELIDYNITELSEYDNDRTWFISYDICTETSISFLMDRVSKEIWCIEANSYNDNSCNRWINPRHYAEYGEYLTDIGLEMNEAYDNVTYVDYGNVDAFMDIAVKIADTKTDFVKDFLKE